MLNSGQRPTGQYRSNKRARREHTKRSRNMPRERAAVRKQLSADLSQRRLYSVEDLWALGLTYSRVHLGRMVKDGSFPAPFHPTPGRIA